MLVRTLGGCRVFPEAEFKSRERHDRESVRILLLEDDSQFAQSKSDLRFRGLARGSQARR
jgi:hypothetical protein